MFSNNNSHTALAHDVSKCIARYLRNGRVVASHYKYARVFDETVTDLGCLVEGELPDIGDVVVIGVVQSDMAKKRVDAVLQLEASIARWKELCEFVPAADDQTEDDDDDDKAMAADFRELHVARLRGRPVVRALGFRQSAPEPEPNLEQYLAKRMSDKKWLCVCSDDSTGCVQVAALTSSFHYNDVHSEQGTP
jgi:hypothetical protein